MFRRPSPQTRRTITLLTAASLAFAISIYAQTPTTPASAPSLTFDIASIRQNTSIGGRNHIGNSTNDGHFTFTTGNAPLKSILHFAFGLPENQIVDAPAWVDSANFDIVAKAGPDADAQLNALEVQVEAANQTLRAADANYRAARAAHGTTIDNNKRSIHIVGGDDSIELLAEYLSRTLARNVVDTTGITGRFDISLKWTPQDSLATTTDPAPDAPPDIFTAIQEQLGLKLVPSKGPVPVLVIDHVEMPSEN